MKWLTREKAMTIELVVCCDSESEFVDGYEWDTIFDLRDSG